MLERLADRWGKHWPQAPAPVWPAELRQGLGPNRKTAGQSGNGGARNSATWKSQGAPVAAGSAHFNANLHRP